MAWSSFQVDGAGNFRKELSENEIRAAVESQAGLLWVDIEAISESDAAVLERLFGFHPVTLQTCVTPEIHTPTVQAFSGYLFLVLHGIDYTADSQLVETTELDVFIGPNFVVSCHNVYLYSVDGVARQVDERRGRLMHEGPDFLAHALIDGLINNIQPTVEGLASRADEIEEIIFDRPHPSTLEAILHLKRSTLRLRRALSPQSDVLYSLDPRQFDAISRDAEAYYRNAYDRVMRILGSIEIIRERTDTILATYLSALAHQQNETMKSLSVVAAVFLPLSLLAGVYGMNFENMPELEIRWGYYAVLGGMGAVTIFTIWWFWARRWWSAGRRRLKSFVPSAVDPERLVGYVSRFTPWDNR